LSSYLSDARRPTEALSYKSLPFFLLYLRITILTLVVDVLGVLLIRLLSMSILTSYCTSLGDVDNVGATVTGI